MSIPLYGVVLSFSHGESVGGGVLGKLARGASGCLMSYRNSGMIGTGNEIKRRKIHVVPIFAMTSLRQGDPPSSEH